MKDCKNTMSADVDTYTQKEYESMETELKTSLTKVIEQFKNTYCVQPILNIIESDKIEVYILNKVQHNLFKY